MSQLERMQQTYSSRISPGLAVEPRENSGGHHTPTETDVGEIILDLVPLEIDTVANAEVVGGRDPIKRFCRHRHRVYS